MTRKEGRMELTKKLDYRGATAPGNTKPWMALGSSLLGDPLDLDLWILLRSFTLSFLLVIISFNHEYFIRGV